MLLLRQLAATGLVMLLMPTWRQRHPLALNCPGAIAPAAGAAAAAGGVGGIGAATTEAAAAAGEWIQQPDLDPAAVAGAAEALRVHVAADAPGFAAALFRQLAHGHPLLGADGGQQRTGRWAGGGGA